MRGRIVVAEARHVAHVARHMRQADRDEAWAWDRLDPEAALLTSLASSPMAWTGMLGDEPVCLFGAAGSAIGTVAAPWMLGTDRIGEVPRLFARLSRAGLAMMTGVWPRLENWSDARHGRAHAWLTWLGFTLGRAQPMGAMGLPFVPFWMEGMR